MRSMSHLTSNTLLSTSTRLLCCIGPPAAILLISISSPKTSILTPLLFIPTAISYRKWRILNTIDPSCRAKLEPLIWTFATAGTLGFAAVTLVSSAIIPISILLIFQTEYRIRDFLKEAVRDKMYDMTIGETIHRAQVAASWQNWAFNMVTCFSTGLLEETLKYLAIAYARRQGTPKERKARNRVYFDYAIVSALGFSVAEGVVFVYRACEDPTKSGLSVAFEVFIRVVVLQAAHVGGAALTAVRAIRKDYYYHQLMWLDMVGPAVLFRGTWEFIADAASALEGHVGRERPGGLNFALARYGMQAGLFGIAVWQLGKDLNGLKDEIDVEDVVGYVDEKAVLKESDDWGID